VERARKITHNMLGFARRMEPHLDDVEVNEVLTQTIDFLANHARINNIEIQTKLQEKLPVIASDQSQLQQVFLNVLNNAIDAIGSNGTIQVATIQKNHDIVISVHDDGPGIPKEMQSKIFDPFYTTKATGKGTGLGLSISFSIVEKMGGSISLTSDPDQGTTFFIRLPVVTPERK
jgi:two-component system NtrC family sensor kinase